MKTKKIAALLFALSLTAAACGSDDAATTGDTTAATEAAGEATTTAAEDTETTEAGEEESTDATEAMAETGTIVDVATDAGDFTTLLAAADAAGLVETLNGPGPLTVFAPTDEAFAAALDSLGLTAEELLADKATLTSILTYHVLQGEVLSTDLTDGMTATTVNGADLTIDLSDGVKVNEANVTTADLEASNGVVHVIDAVLVPPAS